MNTKEIIRSLRRYAHGDRFSCDVNNCPQYCVPEHTTLNLDTSIAWSAANLLELSYTTHEELRLISNFIILVCRHNETYTKLLDLLELAEKAITLLYREQRGLE